MDSIYSICVLIIFLNPIIFDKNVFFSAFFFQIKLAYSSVD